MAKNYNAPDAGKVPGGYGAPTPHAAQVAQQPYTAPSSGQDGVGQGGASTGAFDAMDSAPAWTSTPGEAAESPERYDV
jgi:hypothetical protein